MKSIDSRDKNLISRNESKPTISDCRIVVIDDELSVCEQIKNTLESIGCSNVELFHDGANGLESVLENIPDLLIVDLHMPGMGGLEVLEKLRSQFVYDELPIIMETGRGTPDEIKKLLSIGANNIIRKPIDSDLLISRVCLHLENVMLLRGLRDYRNRLEQELKAARDMQEKLLPLAEDVAKAEGRFKIAIGAHYQPSTELGGDLWGMQIIDDNRIGFYLVDFSGHGVGASINTFRLHTILKQLSVTASPAQYLQILNSKVDNFIERGHYATMVYALVDIEKNTLIYSIAGAPPALVYYKGTDQLSVGSGSGMPLGIMRNMEYEDIEVSFPADASLFLYSDAFYENQQINGDAIGLQGVDDFVRNSINVNSNKLTLDSILDGFFKCQSDSIEDDLTLVVASRA